MSKKWIPGWGMVRFWEGERRGSASHDFVESSDGDGHAPAFPGEVKSGTWDNPARDTLQRLSMLPRRAVLH